MAPDNADVHLSRGIVYEKLLRWQDAIDDYKEANLLIKKRWPFGRDDAVSFSNLANAETGLNLWEEALRDYTYASKLDPNFVAPQLGRSLVLYQLGRPSEAIAYFTALVSKYPDFPDGQAALAVMRFAQGSTGTDVSDAWENAVEGDSRYVDLKWVREIRRWPPALVSSLENFKKSVLYSTITS
jgi:tetratricopeptide (TPR) repeat protein